jgi:CubicO group peptidase (beta-lactamase class C family)
LNAPIDDVLRRGVESGDVPGVVAAATDGNGTIYEAAFGKRALGEAADMTVDTVAWIASLTKPLTATAAMQLVEQGRLELDRPASHWLAELSSVRVLEGFDDAGTPRTRAASKPVTIRHLLTHTSGFGYTMWSADLRRYREASGLPGITNCKNAALDLPLLFEPGERWEYGIGVDWVRKVIEAVTGRKLSAYGRPERAPSENGGPRRDERRGVLPRHAEDLGARLHDHHAAGPDRAFARKCVVGRNGEHLLLDRPRQGSVASM